MKKQRRAVGKRQEMVHSDLLCEVWNRYEEVYVKGRLRILNLDVGRMKVVKLQSSHGMIVFALSRCVVDVCYRNMSSWLRRGVYLKFVGLGGAAWVMGASCRSSATECCSIV